jgi:hypothetical protein
LVWFGKGLKPLVGLVWQGVETPCWFGYLGYYILIYLYTYIVHYLDCRGASNSENPQPFKGGLPDIAPVIAFLVIAKALAYGNRKSRRANPDLILFFTNFKERWLWQTRRFTTPFYFILPSRFVIARHHAS